MITKNPMQLKAFIKKKAEENPQMQNYRTAYQEEFDYAKDICLG